MIKNNGVKMFLLFVIIFFSPNCTKNTLGAEQNNNPASVLIENTVKGYDAIVNDNAVRIREQPLPIASSDTPVDYFTAEFLEKVITKHNITDGNIIFAETKIDGMRVYLGGRIFYDSDGNFWYDSDTLLRYIDYKNYNIILVTQKIDDIEYVRDYLLIEKQNPETYLTHCQGTVKIDGVYPKHDVTVVVNHPWRGRGSIFTEDISQAFEVNMQTRKIEQIFYDTIILYSEI